MRKINDLCRAGKSIFQLIQMEFIITTSEDGMICPLTKGLSVSILPKDVIFCFSLGLTQER